MKIQAIKIYQCELPVVGKPYKMSLSEVTMLDSTIVEVISDTGISGFGETCPLGPTYQPAHAEGARAALCELAPHIIGLDPIQITQAGHSMNAALRGHNYAKAAIDIALWDLAGKSFNRPVSDLLGGASRNKIQSYYAVGIGDPDETARIVKEKQAEGFIRLQIKVGGRSVDEDIAVARKIFEIKNDDVSITLDANRAWNTRDALHLSRSCQQSNFVIEQPCSTYEEIRAIKPQLSHPVYLDECTVDLTVIMKSIHENVADGFGMKVTRVGGLSAMRTIRDICQVTHKPMAVDDSWGGDIIAAACLHLASTLRPELSEGVWIAAPYIEGHYDQRNGISIKNGWLEVPGGPGLGVQPDTSLMQEFRSFGH